MLLLTSVVQPSAHLPHVNNLMSLWRTNKFSKVKVRGGPIATVLRLHGLSVQPKGNELKKLSEVLLFRL